MYLLRDSGIGVDIDLAAAIDAARVARGIVGHEFPVRYFAPGTE